MANKTVSSVADFRNKSEEIITLTDRDAFGELIEFNVRIKRTSMLALVQKGVIPNSLLQSAKKLKSPSRKSSAKVIEEYDEKTINEAITAMEKITEAVLIEPTYEEIKDYLTDSHLSQIVSYLSGGVEALNSFRNEQENLISAVNRQSISDKAE